MEKKYQVFVSSTFRDLKDERKIVIGTLLMTDCIPACMESFVATDEQQFAVIKKIIDLCDYYILILGRKYGTICEETGISYTEMEYEYAISMNIPVLVFALDDTDKLSSDDIETDPEKISKLEAFRTKAMKNRMASIWHSAEDLGRQVAISIVNAKYEFYRPGWQRDTGDEEHRRMQIADLQRTLDLLKENQMLHDDLKRHIKREKELEKGLSEERKYKEYEGKWIQYIEGFERPFSICALIYKDGCYQFNGVNYNTEGDGQVNFNARVVNNSHIIKKEGINSFCYITDASTNGKPTQLFRGFGEVEFRDIIETNAHDGSGYFYDVAAAEKQKKEMASGKTTQRKKGDTAALQEYKIVKYDKHLYARLQRAGYNESFEDFDKKDYNGIWEIANEYKDKCFFGKSN